jgi:hypothetical protein
LQTEAISFIILQNIIAFGISTAFSTAKATNQSSFSNIFFFLHFVTNMSKFFLSGLITIFSGSRSENRLIIVAWVFLSAVPVSARKGVSTQNMFNANKQP